MMKIYHGAWKTGDGESAYGYFLAGDNKDDAVCVLKNYLQKGCKITSISPAALHQVNPQSLTINFPNFS